jgi:hypothetical protein
MAQAPAEQPNNSTQFAHPIARKGMGNLGRATGFSLSIHVEESCRLAS